MRVKELIAELSKYDDNMRVMLCGVEEQDEILGCYEEEILDKDDNVIEKVVSLYEY